MSEDNFLSRWSRRKVDAKTGRPADSPPQAAPAAPEPVPSPERRRLAEPVPAVAERVSIHAADEQPIATARVDEALAEPSAPPTPVTAPAPPAPTLQDVAALAPGDEISRFLARGVDESVKRAAVKKLFADPRYNIMDGLDVYIDDYGVPDPIPMAMLRKMNQAKFLGLFAEEEAAEAQAAARLAAAESGAAPPEPFDEPTADSELPPPAPAQDAEPAAPAAAAALTDATQAPDEDPDLQLQPDDAARRPGAELGAGRERG